MERCEQCGTKLRDGAAGNPLGRSLCASCADTVNGASLGVMSGGGIGGAVAGPGILRWVRKALKPRGRDGSAEAETPPKD